MEELLHTFSQWTAEAGQWKPIVIYCSITSAQPASPYYEAAFEHSP